MRSTGGPRGIRDQERTLAERLISELSGTEFHPDNYEDEYRKRLLKAIEQKIAGQEIQRVEVEARPPTTDLVGTLKASLGRKALAKATPSRSDEEQVAPAKRSARRRRASKPPARHGAPPQTKDPSSGRVRLLTSRDVDGATPRLSPRVSLRAQLADCATRGFRTPTAAVPVEPRRAQDPSRRDRCPARDRAAWQPAGSTPRAAWPWRALRGTAAPR